MLLFYLGCFALLLETSDGNENSRASNHNIRKKKFMRLPEKAMPGYREFSVLQIIPG